MRGGRRRGEVREAAEGGERTVGERRGEDERVHCWWSEE